LLTLFCSQSSGISALSFSISLPLVLLNSNIRGALLFQKDGGPGNLFAFQLEINNTQMVVFIPIKAISPSLLLFPLKPFKICFTFVIVGFLTRTALLKTTPKRVCCSKQNESPKKALGQAPTG